MASINGKLIDTYQRENTAVSSKLFVAGPEEIELVFNETQECSRLIDLEEEIGKAMVLHSRLTKVKAAVPLTAVPSSDFRNDLERGRICPYQVTENLNQRDITSTEAVIEGQVQELSF